MDDQEQPAPIAVSVREASKISGVGRPKLYEAMAAGELAFVKIGARRC